MSDIKSILADRNKTHGEYGVHAGVTQCLKSVMRHTQNWGYLNPSQVEALEMISHKIGRILCGDPKHEDHWLDLCGYAMLVVEELRKSKGHQ